MKKNKSDIKKSKGRMKRKIRRINQNIQDLIFMRNSRIKHGVHLLATVLEKNENTFIVKTCDNITFKISNDVPNFNIEVYPGDQVLLESAKIYQAIVEDGLKTISVKWIRKVSNSAPRFTVSNFKPSGMVIEIVQIN